MIVATEALSSPKVRVGHIGGNFTLPRTVPLASLIAGAVGALLGMGVSLIIVPGLTPLLFCAVFGGALGVATVTLSPLKGESLSRWLGLQLKTRRQRIKLEGDVVQMSVGIALLKTATIGEVHIVPGALNVPPSQYDERGVPLEAQDILQSILESAGVADIANTVMSGATTLDDVEYYTPPQAPWRRRQRPQASEPEPKVPVARTFTPSTLSTPLYAPPATMAPTTIAPTTPTVPATHQYQAPAEAPPDLLDLPEPEGVSDWLPAASLDALFSPPEEIAEVPAPVTSFSVLEKKTATSEWSTPTTSVPDVPVGWTRPSA
jgi:hypothetical protein